MEIALCIIAASYFAFAFRDVQSVVYIAAVAYVLHMFINHPSLFSNGPATPTASIDIDEQAPAPASHRQTRLPEPSATATAAPPLSETPTPITITPSSLSSRSSRSSRSSPHPQAQGKPSRYTFDPVNGGVVHPVDSSSFGSPRGSPRPTPTSAVTSCSTLASPSPSALRRPHRIPDISAGRSPILPVRSVSPPPLSYTPNEHAEPGPAAQAEMAEMPSQIVHTEMVARPKLTLETIHTTPAEKATHRRMGSHRHHSHHTHHTHHHSHSRSHHRQRSSRSPVSFSDATGSCDPDYDSDSSRASTSSTRSTTSSYRSHGLPSYEKHYTMIHTLCPKRAGYLPQIQSVIKAIRPYWLSLPGSVSHEVGHDSEAGTIVIVETYESKDDVLTFEQSKEREKMLARINPFIDESKTTITRLPASSAATRYR